MAKEKGVVNIRGKEYQTVALRVSHFRQRHPHHSLITEIVHEDEHRVVMKASIKSEDWYGGGTIQQTLATGHAEEVRGSSNINKTSALENAETSAIGRALAAFGFGGEEYATADEVANAIKQQSELTPEGSSTAHSKPKPMGKGKAKPKATPAPTEAPVASEEHIPGADYIEQLFSLIEDAGTTEERVAAYYDVKTVEEMTPEQVAEAIGRLTGYLEKLKKGAVNAG